MKKRSIILVLAFYLCCQAVSQPVQDGVVSTGEYSVLAGTYTSGNNGYGTGNDLNSIYYSYRSSPVPTFYIAITGRINSNNNIVLFLDFNSYNGRSTGTLGGGTSSSLGVFKSTGASCSGGAGGIYGARMDNSFDVDFAFAFNEGNSTDRLYLDAMRFSTLNQSPNGYMDQGYVGYTDQSGNASSLTLPFTTLPCGGCPGTITLSYRSDYDPVTQPNSGIEFAIPVSGMPGISGGDYVRFFAAITNSNGEFSNETLPGNPGSSNLGCAPDFSSIPNQQFFTSFSLLPVEFTSFDVRKGANGNVLSWTVNEPEKLKYFRIERSNDGRTFYRIKDIAVLSQVISSYSFTDQHTAENTLYYRITAISHTHQNYTSEIKVIPGNIPVYKPYVFPNPVTGNELRISTSGLKKGLYKMKVHTLDGKIISSQQYRHDGLRSIYSLPIPDHTGKGVYYISVTGESSERYNIKFFKL